LLGETAGSLSLRAFKSLQPEPWAACFVDPPLSSRVGLGGLQRGVFQPQMFSCSVIPKNSVVSVTYPKKAGTSGLFILKLLSLKTWILKRHM